MRRSQTWLTCVALLLVSACGSNGAAPPEPEVVASVSLSPSTASLQAGVGATMQLTATVTGSRGSVLTGQPVSWSASVPTKITVSSAGLVTPLAPGQATVIATVGGRTASSSVTVTPAPETVASVSVTPATVTLQAGSAATAQLTAMVTGSRGSVLTGQLVTWTTTDATRAAVSSAGLVTPVATGQASITATVAGKNASASVTVTPAPIYIVTVTPGTGIVPLGISSQLTATVRDEAGRVITGQSITWSSSDPAAATVDANGLLVTQRIGTVTITASTGLFSGRGTVTVGTAPPNMACKLPNRTGSVGFGFPRLAPRLQTVGTVRATVLFVDFSDAPASRTPQGVLDIIQPTAPSFFSGVSYNRMNLVLQPNLRWLRMSKPSTQYGWPTNVTFASHAAFLQEAADLAAATTDFSQTDLLVVMTNPDAGGITFGPAFIPNTGDGIRVPGRATPIDNATNSGRDLLAWGGTWLNHEIGHLMSLPDLYDYAPPAGRSLHLHVGEWSLMGLISARGREWTAFERWQVGWLMDEQMVCTPAGTTLVSLTPIETTGGTKAAVVPLSPTVAVVVESRRALGFDSRIPQPGPLVYLIDTSVRSGRGTMRVLPLDDADASKVTRTLLVGQSVSFLGVTVTLLSRSDGNDVVQVARP